MLPVLAARQACAAARLPPKYCAMGGEASAEVPWAMTAQDPVTQAAIKIGLLSEGCMIQKARPCTATGSVLLWVCA